MSNTARWLLDNMFRLAISRCTTRGVVLGQERYHIDGGVVSVEAWYDNFKIRTRLTVLNEDATPDEAMKAIDERIASRCLAACK
jgi:hypothetical protein